MATEPLRVVLDTDVLLAATPSHSPYRIVLDELFGGGYESFLSTEIFLEYEEKMGQFFDPETSDSIVGGMNLLPNVHRVEPHFNLKLITADPDDDKFVDCAFAANVNYLVTNDRHFNVLKSLNFPKINLMRIEAFADLLRSRRIATQVV